MRTTVPSSQSEAKPSQRADAQWHYIEGSLIFGNLTLANDGEAHVVVCKCRKDFDRFLADQDITAQDIVWGES
jgi:hypothetical protein